jgi:hypothetical protein
MTDTQKGINNTENSKTIDASILGNIFLYYTLWVKIQIHYLEN